MKINKSSFARISFIAIISLILSACTSGPTINIAKLSYENHPATEAASIQVVTENGVKLKRPYQEIGLIEVEEGPGTQSYDEMIQALRLRAGVLGADALIITTSKKSVGSALLGNTLVSIDAKLIKALAVRWTDR